MEYVRDSKLSTLELLRSLVFRGKKVLSEEGLRIDRIHADHVRTHTLHADRLVLDETPQFSDASRQWVNRGMGSMCSLIGSGSFAASGEEVRVLGDRSCAVHASNTRIQGNQDLLLGGQNNVVHGNTNTLLGTSNVTVDGHDCLILGGQQSMSCTANGNVVVRTPNVDLNPNGQTDRIFLAGTHGVCMSVEPTITAHVHTVPIRVGATIPEKTIHWSIDRPETDQPPQLIVSYKSEDGCVYEAALPMRANETG